MRIFRPYPSGGGGGNVTGSGASGQNAFFTGLHAIAGDNFNWWDNATKRFGIGRNFSVTAPESVFTNAGSVSNQKITTTAVNYNVLASDYYVGSIPVPPAAVTLTLPLAAGVDIKAGKEYELKDQVGAAALGTALTIAAQAGETIDMAANVVITTAFGGIKVKSLGGTQWAITGLM